jgi:hypothetical protein
VSTHQKVAGVVVGLGIIAGVAIPSWVSAKNARPELIATREWKLNSGAELDGSLNLLTDEKERPICQVTVMRTGSDAKNIVLSNPLTSDAPQISRETTLSFLAKAETPGSIEVSLGSGFSQKLALSTEFKPFLFHITPSDLKNGTLKFFVGTLRGNIIFSEVHLK